MMPFSIFTHEIKVALIRFVETDLRIANIMHLKFRPAIQVVREIPGLTVVYTVFHPAAYATDKIPTELFYCAEPGTAKPGVCHDDRAFVLRDHLSEVT